MEVLKYQPNLSSDVVRLIVEIQRDEFSIEITAAQQPDLLNIPGFYQVRNGNFWVAIANQEVVGTVALLDIGKRQAALRKMFVHRAYRGDEIGTARCLLGTLLDWSRTNGFHEIFLGTNPRFLAAHRFYEKNGFGEIAESDLPAAFPIMTVDKKFYRRVVEATA